jgi:hypothetical protein
MAKKPVPPPLTLVSSSATGSSPTRRLGATGADLWASITAEYDIDDAGGIETLMQICAAADRLGEVAAQIARDGLTVHSKSGLREHPLLKMELGLRAFITRNLQRLGINVEPVKNIGRPGRGFGWKPE